MQEHVLSATHSGSGSACSVVDGRTTVAEVRPGTLTFLPQGQEGEYRCGATETSNIYLGTDRLQSCADQLAEGRSFELMDRIQFDDERTFSVMKLMADEADSSGLHSRIFLEHALDLLCVQLLRSHSSLAIPLLHRQYGLAPWQVKRVTNYMRENLGVDISLQDLANIVGMSRYHFCTAFRKATGATPHGYLTRVRMELACSLLHDSPLRVGDVALAVSYGTMSAFSTAFRRYMGITPQKYRNLRRS